jgi:hypothetical protein
MLAIALCFALLGLFFITVLYFSKTASLSRANAALRADLERKEQELGRLQPQLENAQQELEQILSGRYPHLHRLEPDKVLTLNQGHIKNIVFTVVKHGGERKYEYKVVMENSQGHEIRPDFTLIVFDTLGVQTGISEASQLGALAPGESRSHSAVVDIFLEREPRYFYVSAKPVNQRSSPQQKKVPLP